MKWTLRKVDSRTQELGVGAQDCPIACGAKGQKPSVNSMVTVSKNKEEPLEPCMFASFRTLTKRRTRLTRAPRATSSEADVSGLGQLAIEIFTSDWLLLAVSSRGNDLAVVLRRLV